MPLYMDFHKIAGLTLEDVRKAHLADLAVQEKFGVKYHQFWLNQEAGTIFCLTEGPDMKTCEMVHRLAHGNVACAMTEVQPGYYKIFMGEDHQLDHGIVRNRDGSMDLGYRSILVVRMEHQPNLPSPRTHEHLPPSPTPAKRVNQLIEDSNGRRVREVNNDTICAVFDDATVALKCARAIQEKIASDYSPLACRIGLSAGQPVTENGDFFTNALTVARQMSSIASERRIVISSLAAELCDDDELRHPSVTSLNTKEEKLVVDILQIVEHKLSDETFSIDGLCHDMGISRPQLYRNLKRLAGRSPNELLRDLRMDRAVALLKRNRGNISEIALEVGYNSPSYFTRCFTEKFGWSPSQFVTACAKEKKSGSRAGD